MSEAPSPQIASLAAGDLLRCPATGEPLEQGSDGWLETPNAGRRYPYVDGVPILISAENEVFDARSYASAPAPQKPGLLRRLAARLPQPSRNLGARERVRRLAELVRSSGHKRWRPPARACPRRRHARGRHGADRRASGTRRARDRRLPGTPHTARLRRPRASLQGRQLRRGGLPSGARACLGPSRVVAEIQRVLAPEGIVYSEMPFMQQVHEGAHDFTRFTLLDHRRLLRRFDVIEWGAQGGPGMALGWSIQHIVMAFADRSRRLHAVLGRLTGAAVAWLTWLDPLLARRPGGLDAASGTYIIGRPREEPVPDREIIASYPGACPSPERT